MKRKRVISHIRTFLKRHLIRRAIYIIYKHVFGMRIHKGSIISSKARLDFTNPRGIVIGENSVITTGAVVLSHDFSKGDRSFSDTVIGKNVFVGVNSIIMPGVVIGDNVIVGAGSVVTKDVSSNCIVAGNPATVIRSDVPIGRYGQLSRPPKDRSSRDSD